MLTPEEQALKRAKDRLRKQKSRSSQTRQKLQGNKIKNRNQKRKKAAKSKEEAELESESAQRVRVHREKLKVSMTFPSRRRNKRITEASTLISKSLTVLSPQSKVKSISMACSSLSPSSRSSLSNSIVSNPLLNVYTSLKRKRDTPSNCARRLLLNELSSVDGANKVRRTNRNISWRSLQHAVNNNAHKIVIHYKTVKSRLPKPPTETVKKVSDFYNLDTTSRQLPYKNFTRKIKDHSGEYHRVPVRVMEVTLRTAFHRFKQLHPDLKISQRSFERLRPKYVRLRRCAQRLQCCCTYHTNMDYIRRALNKLFLANGKDIPFPNS